METSNARPASDTDTKQLSDEEYLVEKAQTTAASNIHRSKAWTLTAKTLFPQNFDIQFEAYLIEKKNGNTKEAAKCFSSLFQSFVSENGLWGEIHAFTTALRAENPTPDQTFLRNIFSSMPQIIQHDILTVTAERSEDTMDHCRLMLLLFKRFPQSTLHLTMRLVDTLITAEKHGHCSSVINCYRKTLVCEVLPLLLNSNTEVSSKQLYRLLHKSIEFYLAYLMAKPCSVENLLDQENRADISWESLFNLFRTFGAKFEWKLSSIFNSPWNRELAWQEVNNAVQDGSLDVRQIIYCLTIVFAYNLHQYNQTVYPLSEGTTAAILVEAFVKKEEVAIVLPPKKMKLQIDGNGTEANGPFLSCGEGVEDALKYFNSTYKCWNVLNSNDVYLKEFTKLKQHIKLDVWLLDFVTDVSLYRNRFDEYLSNVQLNPAGDYRTLVQRLSFNYVTKNYLVVFQACICLMETFEDDIPLGNYNTSALTASNVSRHLHFIPVEQIPLMQFAVKLLVITYWQHLPNAIGSDLDRLYGCLLVLCQVSWPSEKSIVVEILKRIRARRTFTFPLFFKYVINLEILEEFTFLVGNEQDGIKLDLTGTGHTPSTKRISTRGANKEERADFRHMMQQQVCRQEPLHKLIIQFLTEEPDYVTMTRFL